MLNGKPVTLLDCDDVVARCANAMLSAVFEKTGVVYTEEDLTKTWDLFDNLDHPEHPDLKEHVEETMRQRGWCLKLEAFPGAVEGVKKLREISEVFFLTSPFWSPYWEYERRVWLNNHFDLPRGHVMQGSSKFLVRGEVFVDDNPDHVREWRNYGYGMGLLWDRPHNRFAKGFQRITSWEMLYDIVGRFT